jgi:glycosyltransferase involved in cell wall biosynthesis
MFPFSVLMSVYYKERPDYLKIALDSIFSQTLKADEVVLVEDGQLTDELNNVIREYQIHYPELNVIPLEKNVGLGRALNFGVTACKNDIIARMDSDDVIPRDRFEKQLKIMEQGYDVVSCWSLIFKNSVDNVVAIKKRPENHEDIVKLAKRRSPVCHAACFLRKSAVINAGNYQHRQYNEDYHLWARMIQSGAKFYNVQEPLYYVRTTEEQLQRRGGWKYLKTELKVFSEFYNMGFYSFKDLLVNSAIRIAARLIPGKLRAFMFKKIWNHNNGN